MQKDIGFWQILERAALYFILVLVPVIVHLHQAPASDLFREIADNRMIYDYYTYYKTLALAVAVVCSLPIALKRIFSHERSKYENRLLVFIGVILALSIIGAAATFDVSSTVMGALNNKFGLLAWLSLWAVWALVFALKSEDAKSVVERSLVVLSFVLAIICLTEKHWPQLLNLALIQQILIGTELYAQGGRFTLTGYNAAAGPAYNPNYMGQLAGLVLVIGISSLRTVRVPSLRQWPVYFSIGLMSYCLIITGSKSNLIFALASVVFGLSFSWAVPPWRFSWGDVNRNVLAGCVVAGLGLFVGSYLNPNLAVTEVVTKIAFDASATPDFDPKKQGVYLFGLKGVGDDVVIFTSKGDAWIRLGLGSFQFAERTSEQALPEATAFVPFSQNTFGLQGDITYDSDILVLSLPFPSASFPTKLYGTPGGVRMRFGDALLQPVYARPAWTPFPDHAFSFRGFIWNRTLPLISECGFFGCGFAKFGLLFPNADLNRVRYFGEALIDVPHNGYLRVFIEQGILQGVCFTLMIWGSVCFVFYLVANQKYQHKLDPSNFFTAIPILYFAASLLLNDLSICVLPVFFAYLGLHHRVLIGDSHIMEFKPQTAGSNNVNLKGVKTKVKSKAARRRQ